MGVKRKFQAVKDVMTEKIVYIDGMATAKEASELMKKEKVGVLIVKKRDEKDENGIVVIKDFINNVIIPDRTSEEVNVYEMMSKPVFTVPANMDIAYVAKLLIKVGVRVAPVEENGELIGIVSLKSLIIDNSLF